MQLEAPASTGAPAGQARPQLAALTGLRFFAAMQVVAYHFGGPLVVNAPSLLRSVLEAGYTGVSLFFVLSGFILTYTYAPRAVGGRIDRRDFWAARFARIYPVYLLGFLLAAPSAIKAAMSGAAMAAGALRSAGFGAAALALVQAWHPVTAIAWNIPAWSLSVEAFFYLLFPLLVLPRVLRLSERALPPAMAACWLLSMLAPALYYLILPDGSAPGRPLDQNAPWMAAIKYSPLARLPEFVLGACLGRLYLLDQESGRKRPGAVLAGGAVALLAAALALSDRLPYLLLHNGLLAPAYAMLLLGLAQPGEPAGIGRMLALPVVVLLGEASYALYLLHLNFWPWAMRILGLASPAVPRSPAPAFLGYLALLLPLTVIIFLRVETPLRRQIRARLSHRRNG